ncbi:MAG: 50S ribosomal protein L4 [Deltaproteobacteria bacterium]|nr:50S ribosomal protein L4 [Deltaproteobacteria bacterium]
MKWDVINIRGEKVREVELPESIYNVDMNEAVLHSVVKAYQANRRQGTHATKTRSLVSGGGKKPFRQKGTGNARQGSSRSPLMPGGATAHGPQPRDYRQHINRKQKKLALKVALSDKARHKKLILVDDFVMNKYSTKHVLSVLGAMGNLKNALLTDERRDDFLYKSARNLHRVGVMLPGEMNSEDILRYETLVISETALKALGQRLGEES